MADWSKYTVAPNKWDKYSVAPEAPKLPELPNPFKVNAPIPPPQVPGMGLKDIWSMANAPVAGSSPLPGPLPKFTSARGLDVVNPDTARAIGEPLTSPLSIATQAAGPIGKSFPLAGNIIGKGAGALQASEGIRNLFEGDYGTGAINLGMGAFGLAGKYGNEIPKVSAPVTEAEPLKLFKKTPVKVLNDKAGIVKPNSIIDTVTEMHPQFMKNKETVLDAVSAVPKKVESKLVWKDKVSDWHYADKATDYQGLEQKKKFSELDSLGTTAIDQIQEGSNLKGVREYFNNKFKEVQAIIPDVKFRENYLPQLWKNTKEEVELVFGQKRLGLRPSFTLGRVIKDYKEGIEKGLKPQFETVSDLVGWYEQKANKAINNRELWNYGKNSGLISIGKKDNYIAMNPDLFPFMVDSKNQGKVFYAEPQFAQSIERLLKKDDSWIGSIAKPVSFMKNMMLTGGIPGTGVNWHSAVSIPTRALINSGVKRMLQTYYYDVHPGAAKSFIEDNLGEAVDAVKHGMSMGSEGFWKATSAEDRSLAAKFEGAFSDATFKEIIPAIKLKSWQELWPKLVSKGMDIKAAKKAAAEFTNNSYGGVQGTSSGQMRNIWENPETKNILQLGMLAPDWFATKYNLGVGAVKALTDPKNPLGQEYLKIVGKMALLFGVESAVGLSLRNSSPNSSSRITNIPVGSVSAPNKTRKDAELVPSGTSLDTVGIPAKAAYDTIKGNPGKAIGNLRYQLSPPIQAGIDTLRGENALGDQVWSPFGNDRQVPRMELFENTISNLLGYVVPQPIQAGVDYATGKISGKEAAAQALELPFRFYNRPRR